MWIFSNFFTGVLTVTLISVDEGELFDGHDEAWGHAQFEDYVAHHYHQPSDEYRADWDFSGNAKLARFGFVLGWLASEQPESVEWKSGDEFETPRKKEPRALTGEPVRMFRNFPVPLHIF